MFIVLSRGIWKWDKLEGCQVKVSQFLSVNRFRFTDASLHFTPCSQPQPRLPLYVSSHICNSCGDDISALSGLSNAKTRVKAILVFEHLGISDFQRSQLEILMVTGRADACLWSSRFMSEGSCTPTRACSYRTFALMTTKHSPALPIAQAPFVIFTLLKFDSVILVSPAVVANLCVLNDLREASSPSEYRLIH